MWKPEELPRVSEGFTIPMIVERCPQPKQGKLQLQTIKVQSASYNSTQKYVELPNEFVGVTNKEGNLTLVFSGVCPGNSDELNRSDCTCEKRTQIHKTYKHNI